MEIMGIGSVAAITVICYLVGMTVRQTPLDNKWIPSIVGGIGLILGFVGWMVIPDYPAADILTALAVGIVSGLAATGIDQIYRQLNPSDKGEDDLDPYRHDHPPDGQITVLAYEDYDEDGSPKKDGEDNADR